MSLSFFCTVESIVFGSLLDVLGAVFQFKKIKTNLITRTQTKSIDNPLNQSSPDTNTCSCCELQKKKVDGSGFGLSSD